MQLMNSIESDYESDMLMSNDESFSDDGRAESAQNDELYASNSATVKTLLDYKIISEQQLLEEMDQMSKETATILQCSISMSKTILNQYEWNKDILLEKFLDNEDSQAFFAAINLTNAGKKEALISTAHRRLQCEICFETKPLVGLQCEHLFCRGCWSGYIKEKAVNERCSSIRCPEHGCNALLDYDSVVTLAKNCEVKIVYDKLLFRSFVECNKLLKRCPGIGCGHVVKLSSSVLAPVTCTCGLTFCHQCSEQWHQPTDCALLRAWLKKCSDDSETSNYIMANTKECPKCHGIIEKNGGCNHMTCKNLSCRNEFCWICLGPWAAHGNGYYACNRFNDDSAKKARDSQERSRAELARYLHYFNRYANHQHSLKLETKLYSEVEGRMDQMQRQGVTWIDSQYLRKAVDVLGECRRIMMFTYPFAYYLDKDSHNTKIFEDNQQDLEIATEKLSHLLENNLENVDLMQLKQQIQDKCSYVDKRRGVLLKHCAEGYEKNQWEFVHGFSKRN